MEGLTWCYLISDIASTCVSFFSQNRIINYRLENRMALVLMLCFNDGSHTQISTITTVIPDVTARAKPQSTCTDLHYLV
jgi:hypothetical protein